MEKIGQQQGNTVLFFPEVKAKDIAIVLKIP